jgi:hypothetical protein
LTRYQTCHAPSHGSSGEGTLPIDYGLGTFAYEATTTSINEKNVQRDCAASSRGAASASLDSHWLQQRQARHTLFGMSHPPSSSHVRNMQRVPTCIASGRTIIAHSYHLTFSRTRMYNAPLPLESRLHTALSPNHRSFTSHSYVVAASVPASHKHIPSLASTHSVIKAGNATTFAKRYTRT